MTTRSCSRGVGRGSEGHPSDGGSWPPCPIHLPGASGQRRFCAGARTARAPVLPGRPGTPSSSSRDAERNASGEPKWFSIARLRAGPTPGRSSSTELVIARSRRVRWWVIAKRCASSRTRWSSCSSGVSWARRSGCATAGQEDLLDALGQRDDGDAAVEEPAQRLEARAELARAAVDDDHVGQRREGLVVLGVVGREVCWGSQRASAGAAPRPSRRSRRVRRRQVADA